VKTGGRRIDRAIVIVEALIGLGVVVAIVGKSYGWASTVAFAACGVALAFTGYVLVRMVTALGDESLDAPGRVFDDERARLEHEKLLLLQGIKEFDADAATGKVDRADYDHLRRTAEARAMEIISILKESDARWMREAERLVTQRVGATTAAAQAKDAPAPPVPAVTVGPLGEAGPAAPLEIRGEPALAALFDPRPVRLEAFGEALRCAGCQTENGPGGRYCVGCGRPVEVS
jgi:hypothetical protein